VAEIRIVHVEELPIWLRNMNCGLREGGVLMLIAQIAHMVWMRVVNHDSFNLVRCDTQFLQTTNEWAAGRCHIKEFYLPILPRVRVPGYALSMTSVSQIQGQNGLYLLAVTTPLKGMCSVPRVILTDKLGSYVAAKREVLPGVEHRQRRSLNNRCAVSL
jgi:hypothetical protein